MDRMRFLELFLAESREHIAAAYELLAGLERAGETEERETLRELGHHGHSLKGMASTMGFTSMVRLAHALEDLIEFLQRAPARASVPFVPRIHEGLAALGRIVDAVERGQSARSPESELVAAQLARAMGRSPAPSQTLAADEDPADDGSCPTRWALELTLDGAGEAAAQQALRALRELGMLGRLERVDPPVLQGSPARFDGRLNCVLVFDGTEKQLEGRLEAMLRHSRFRIRPEPSLAPAGVRCGAASTWARVRAELLDRVLESVLDLLDEKARALAAGDDPAEMHRRLERCGLLLKQLYGRVMELRLEPFGSVAYRLNQCTRQLENDLGKRVQFRIEGSHIQVDRSLLAALVDPLEQMVRNAMDHGLEPGEERLAAGKPEEGSLVLTLDRQGGDLVIVLADDGRGLCPRALRREAIERGLVNEDQATGMTDAEALRLITEPAFSTVERLTETSGRGIGMDLVRETVERLGGRLAVASEHGRGTRFEVKLPLNLALIRALIVRCAGQTFALPVGQVERTIDPKDGRTRLPHVRLDQRLGLAAEGAGAAGAVLVLDLPRGPLGLVVDEVLGQREVTVKPLPAPLADLRDYSGAALLDDGTIALLVDPYRLENPA